MYIQSSFSNSRKYVNLCFVIETITNVYDPITKARVYRCITIYLICSKAYYKRRIVCRNMMLLRNIY